MIPSPEHPKPCTLNPDHWTVNHEPWDCAWKKDWNIEMTQWNQDNTQKLWTITNKSLIIETRTQMNRPWTQNPDPSSLAGECVCSQGETRYVFVFRRWDTRTNSVTKIRGKTEKKDRVMLETTYDVCTGIFKWCTAQEHIFRGIIWRLRMRQIYSQGG